jgi:hypothetical protein
VPAAVACLATTLNFWSILQKNSKNTMACFTDSRSSTTIHQRQHWMSTRQTRISLRAELQAAFQQTLDSQTRDSTWLAVMWRSPLRILASAGS